MEKVPLLHATSMSTVLRETSGKQRAPGCWQADASVRNR